MGHNLYGQLFIEVLYAAKKSAIIIVLSLFWSFFPLGWREWRFDEIVLQFPGYYNIFLITDPQ